MKPKQTKAPTETAVQKVNGHTYSIETIEKQVEFAGVLQKFLIEQKLISIISGKKYVQVEGWQFSGMTLGLIPIVDKPKRLEGKANEIRYECECTLIRQATGEKVGYGYAICSNEEKSKKGFDEYAICSMSQTRCIAKAYRNLLAFVVKMAGFEATPAEEMDGVKDFKEPEKMSQSDYEEVRTNAIAVLQKKATVADLNAYYRVMNKQLQGDEMFIDALRKRKEEILSAQPQTTADENRD